MGTSFIFYPSFLEALEGLPDDSYMRLTRCIHAYGTTGEETALQGLERNIFATIKAQIDANKVRREKGEKYGAMGGRPRKSAKKTHLKEPENATGELENGEFYSGIEDEKGGFSGEKGCLKKNNSNENANVNANVNANENANENEKVPPVFFPENSSEKNPQESNGPPSNLFSRFDRARKVWNDEYRMPECRGTGDMSIRADYLDDVRRVFGSYTDGEIRNAIHNYHWHKTKADRKEYGEALKYASFYGFIKNGVEKYFDDKGVDLIFKAKT
jgi:hypothetical protein